MPILTRFLDYARPQRDGRFRCRVSGVDTAGRAWIHGPFWADSVADAEAIRDGVVWDVEGAEERDVIQWIEDGNDPDLFPRVEMTLNEFRRRLAKRVANLPFEGNERFFCNISPWVLGFTATQISNVLGINLAKAQKILDRASRLDTTICPALELDNGDVQGDV